MKVAVIGAGISGNVAAHHLAQAGHAVTVFEAGSHLGGHTHTHDLEWAGRHYAVDSGFIVFNSRTYPNFIALMKTLGVDYQPTEMSFSVKCERTGLEYNGHTLNTLFAQRRNLLRPSFYRMVREILRFNREAPRDLDRGAAQMSLGEYLTAHRYSRAFTTQYILPMGAAIWSTDPQQMQDVPAAFFIRFFVNHGLLEVANRPPWYVIKGGSRMYLKPLSAPYANSIRLRTPVTAVRRLPEGVEVVSAAHGRERYDAVVFATHSDQALTLLTDPSPNERAILGQLRYQRNEAVLHTDTTVLPRRPLAWASWNYHLKPGEQRVALTYDMNRLQGLDAPVRFLVTLNDTDAIDPRKIIKRLEYEHPMYTAASVEAQTRHGQINGVDRTYYCGAYWGNGFHEDGVVSALKVVHQLQEAADAQPALRRAG